MIKKLKRKFIANSMLLVGIVIISVFLVFHIFIYALEENKLHTDLNSNIYAIKNNIHSFQSTQREPSDRVYDVSLVILVGKGGKILASTPNNFNNTYIEQIASKVAEIDYDRGRIRGMNLSFSKIEIKEGTLISVLSREHLNERVKESRLQSLIAVFLSLLLFLYISKRLADIAIAPIEKAWDQQKQFLADASHDLKTPLTVILANNNIISSHKEETVQSQMQWIESTGEEAVRMRDLVNNMLELAKGEAAKEELTIWDTNISETVENAMLQFEVVAFERNVSIEGNIQPNIFVKTHRATFAKILEILFDNAIKYSNENEKVSVALYQSSKKVFFTINNKGEHISPDELPHIFERFYRTNKEREVGGHGLGLSIAKKKCDMIGAKISVESNENDGTTFIITLKVKNNY